MYLIGAHRATNSPGSKNRNLANLRRFRELRDICRFRVSERVNRLFCCIYGDSGNCLGGVASFPGSGYDRGGWSADKFQRFQGQPAD